MSNYIERMDDRLDEQDAEIANLRAERLALRQAVALFASAIKSGEPWTDVCERTLRSVMDGPAKTP